MNNIKIALYNNDDAKMTPAETITEMFEYTDENGVLYIPEWIDDGTFEEDQRIYKCVMDWTETDVEKLIAQHQSLYDALAKIAELTSASGDNFDVRSLPEDLQAVWNTYIRDFETGDIDPERIHDFVEHLDMLDLVDSISKRIKAGESLTEDELAYYNEHREIKSLRDEFDYYGKYRDAVKADSVRRIGSSIAAYDVILRAKRLFRLLALTAPSPVINNEACFLAQAMAIHEYGKSLEVLDTCMRVSQKV